MTTSPIPVSHASAASLHEDSAWTQVLARDIAAKFTYAVTTTGICCRPSCPSRRPARENVRFFPNVDAAIEAGFRPCMRCRPTQTSAVPRRDTILVEKLCEFLRQNVDRAVTLDELGKRARLPGLTVQRKFERVLGVTPKQFQLELRASGFRTLLSAPASTESSITDAVYEAGYSASSRVYTHTQQNLGMTPARFRDGGRGEIIQFVTAPCALGHILVAATPVGICSVTLGDDPAALEDELRRRFSKAAINAPAAGSELNQAVAMVLSQLTDHPAKACLPLDLRATVFQQRVWKALAAIPRGETRSYSQIAAELGQPTAARAVARACASNPVALLVPCHRVIGASGSLTGYRWGKDRKERLLQIESQ